ncbi:bacillithiol biosynthesis deacetylase BshB1 [Rhodocytophaga rosea]|uniref:Bacillithiol biosynthesis deacetylase BshB1 n=1 Tax=Rhodocytophaga rosea TaxID=2704465 RepID=A0A6C0GXP1_9BACT|nr:bacillithiol biosynthesis deacetylase BshB1 [Rhodocytophaga rosea]QHT72262.1 bacillithiol biosynthesis deacetylase BshB1 [Rhodocytophaga rosea]
MKLDILAIASHPDDVELSCAGTLLLHKSLGHKVGVIDLTRGELGTRGTPETRKEEAAEASKLLSLDVRENMNFADGFFQNDRFHQMELIAAIRAYQPEIVLLNAIEDRHPDHGKGAQLEVDACFLSGLKKIITYRDNQLQEAWRPKAMYHFIQDRYIKPDFVVDITSYWEQKVAAIRAYKTQFYDPNSPEPNTYISSPEFVDFLSARAQEWGHSIGVKYGEGFTKARQIGVRNLFDLI